MTPKNKSSSWLFLAILRKKYVIKGHVITENTSNYSEPSYFDIAEVVKHFGLERGRRSDYDQIYKMAKNKTKNYVTSKYVMYNHILMPII